MRHLTASLACVCETKLGGWEAFTASAGVKVWRHGDKRRGSIDPDHSKDGETGGAVEKESERRMVKLKKKEVGGVRLWGEGLAAETGCCMGIMRPQEDINAPTSYTYA